MALTHLLDTSVYAQPLKRIWVPSAIQRWREIGDKRICTSILCHAELLQGLELRQSKDLWDLYEMHLKGQLTILPVDDPVAETYAKLHAAHRKTGRIYPPFHLLIAATAKAHRLILATLNFKDFADIEGLAVEDWSK